MTPATPSFARRLLLTLAAAALLVGGGFILAPGVDRTPLSPHADGNDAAARLTIFAIGVVPWVTSFLVVEFAAIVAPRWRWLRHGGPSARRRLMPAVAIVGVMFAALQALFLLRTAHFAGPFTHALVHGTRDEVLFFSSIVAGSVVAAILAQTISRQGLCNGFAIATSVHTVFLFVGPSHVADPAVAPSARLMLVLYPLVALLVAIGAAPSHVRGDATTIAPWPPLPACGLGVASIEGAMLTAHAAVAGHTPTLAALKLTYGLRESLTLSLLLAIALSYAMQRPDRVAKAMAASRGATHATLEDESAARRSLWSVLLPTCGFVATIGLADAALGSAAGRWWHVSAIATVTAIVLDFGGACVAHLRARALASIGEERRPYVVALLGDALAREGIALRATQTRQLALLRVFGPYLGAELWVDAAHAPRALEIWERFWTIAHEPERVEAPVYSLTPAPPPVPVRAIAQVAWARASFMIVACGLASLIFLHARADAEARAELSIVRAKDVTIEVVEVADDVDLLESYDEPALPRGVRVISEMVPVGLDEVGSTMYLPGHYARGVVQPDETPTAAKARLHAWLDPIAKRRGLRVLTGEWVDYSGDVVVRDPTAFRAYFVRREPLLTQADVARAEVAIGDYDQRPYVSLTLSEDGAVRFGDATERLVKRRLAIVIDDVVDSAPIVQTKIGGGRI
ncbi:MAG: hypothetical protein ACHREM_24645, partial [Polyangiales bacterium]